MNFFAHLPRESVQRLTWDAQALVLQYMSLRAVPPDRNPYVPWDLEQEEPWRIVIDRELPQTVRVFNWEMQKFATVTAESSRNLVFCHKCERLSDREDTVRGLCPQCALPPAEARKIITGPDHRHRR